MRVSVVSPYYNEASIIAAVVEQFEAALASLPCDHELILVNDGSTDGSDELAKNASRSSSTRFVGYAQNRGRGYALRHGASVARGEIIVTTEIDLSWGKDIVHRLLAAFDEFPDADIIVASPNLPGGGYRDVPLRRVLISRFGNRIIRLGHGRHVSMYTGMTRAYRAESFRRLPLDQMGKEFHLEVLQKALALGLRVRDIPSYLEWQAHRFADTSKSRRKSSSNVNRLIFTHSVFALAAAPFRYLLPASLVIGGLAAGFFAWAVVNVLRGETSILLLLVSVTLIILAIVSGISSVLSFQLNSLQRDVWRLRSEIRAERSSQEGQ